MNPWITSLCALAVLSGPLAPAQSSSLGFPARVEAGTVFSLPTSGSGAATLYIVGPGDALRRTVQLGNSVAFGPDDLHHAGHYIALLVSATSSQSVQFDVVASPQPATLSFLAKPSRLPVNRPDAVSGVAYVFDAFGNLVLQPQQVSFALTDANGGGQSRKAATRDGVAWVKMNSAAKSGPAQFQASAGNVRETRVVQQVPGDPCTVKMSARDSAPRQSAQRLVLETDSVRDCSGNAVPDGTIVTFTEMCGGLQATVDVPLKRGIARTELPACRGAQISVATGVVMGNEIRWSGQ